MDSSEISVEWKRWPSRSVLNSKVETLPPPCSKCWIPNRMQPLEISTWKLGTGSGLVNGRWMGYICYDVIWYICFFLFRPYMWQNILTNFCFLGGGYRWSRNIQNWSIAGLHMLFVWSCGWQQNRFQGFKEHCSCFWFSGVVVPPSNQILIINHE